MENLISIGAIVSAEWLARHIENPNLVVLEVILTKDEESSEKLPKSRIFNIDLLSDPESNLPHMMPTVDHFTQGIRNLGINQDSIIIVYDKKGIYSSPRAWFMFQAMGFKNVAVLNGGLPAWKSEGFPITNHSSETKSGNFKAQLNPGIFCDIHNVDLARSQTDIVIVDARSAGRFSAREPEPRPNLRRGNIPNSINIPFTDVLNGVHMKPVSELVETFEKNFAGRKKIIVSCGSGVTACIVGLAAIIAGYESVQIYDGSWTEWAQQ